MSSNKPILYSSYISSCCWRVRNALAMKNIDYEYRTINTSKNEQKDEEYLALNPMGQIPAFVVDGKTITQSISILEYIEEVYSDVPLLPENILQRAKVREICEIIASGIQPLQKVPVLKKTGDESVFPNAKDCIETGFTTIEIILEICSDKYCVGDTVTLADCCLVPQVNNAKRFDVDLSQFPLIRKITDHLMELEAFKIAHPSNQPDCPPEMKSS